jgi:hypothetical protein
MSGDILSRLHKELEGTTANSPAVCELLCEAAEEIERLRVLLAARERFLKALLAARDKRGGRRGDDDGAAEVILTGPPKTPRGGSPAFATRLDDGDELTPSVQNEVPRGLVEQPETGIDNGQHRHS